jgi:hypothetical protein
MSKGKEKRKIKKEKSPTIETQEVKNAPAQRHK